MFKECETRVNVLVAGCVPRSGMCFMQIPIFQSTSAELTLSPSSFGQFNLYLSEPILLIPSSLKQFANTYVEESSVDVPLTDFRRHLYNSPVQAATVVSFNQPQNVAQIIDLLAAWKRIQLIVQNWRTKCKVYFNISENGIIQYRNRAQFESVPIASFSDSLKLRSYPKFPKIR